MKRRAARALGRPEPSAKHHATKAAPHPAPPREPVPPTPHVPFLLDDSPSAGEHGERRSRAARSDTFVGTSGSHTPAADTRAEEPFGEIGPGPAFEPDPA